MGDCAQSLRAGSLQWFTDIRPTLNCTGALKNLVTARGSADKKTRRAIRDDSSICRHIASVYP